MINDTEIITMLRAGWVTKETLCAHLGLSERNTRQYIENLNKKLIPLGSCVLSTASRKGYHIPDPCNPIDIDIAKIAVEELKSKAISIFERRKVIEDFINRYDTEASQPTLF